MSKKILIVDDSEVTRNFHAYILRSAGFKVLSAQDGAEALELLYLEGDIDLILTDLNMPNMDGLSLIRRIRGSQEFSHIPIIIVTTLDEAKDKEKGFEAGANYYITKPAQPAYLLESIGMFLGGK
ncbi:response regulator [Candidatus Caldatribacterium sp. SIUC1]|uniref:response regulator n=1 Tax=Candidatus Caldatribacterium sp. SIUC1 TaxID=3418365 RepID=UPI003F68DBEA